MTINRKSFARMSFTCRVKPETKKMIEAMAAKLSNDYDSHIALGVVVDRAIAEMMTRMLPEADLGERTEGGADAAEKGGLRLGA